MRCGARSIVTVPNASVTFSGYCPLAAPAAPAVVEFLVLLLEPHPTAVRAAAPAADISSWRRVEREAIRATYIRAPYGCRGGPRAAAQAGGAV